MCYSEMHRIPKGVRVQEACGTRGLAGTGGPGEGGSSGAVDFMPCLA